MREYEDEWIVLLGGGGECLGVVCSGCVADEELLALELEAALDEREPASTADRAHGARERTARRRTQARRPRARARALASARRD